MANETLLSEAMNYAADVLRLYIETEKNKDSAAVFKKLLLCATKTGEGIKSAGELRGYESVKMYDASLKELTKSLYWLELLRRSDTLNEAQVADITLKVTELKKLIASELQKN